MCNFFKAVKRAGVQGVRNPRRKKMFVFGKRQVVRETKAETMMGSRGARKPPWYPPPKKGANIEHDSLESLRD